MRKLKILFSLIILLCLIILVSSNWAFFSNMQAFDINLYKPVLKWQWPLKWQPLFYHFPPAATGIYLLGCFILGILVAYFKSLMARFKNTQRVKTLQAENKLQAAKLADLQKEVDFLQRNASKPAPPRAPVNEAPVGTSQEVKKDDTDIKATTVSKEA